LGALIVADSLAEMLRLYGDVTKQIGVMVAAGRSDLVVQAIKIDVNAEGGRFYNLPPSVERLRQILAELREIEAGASR
jgi:hypothetical protein